MSYEKCREKFLSQILGEFEKGKLKMINNKKVKNKRQAIAIALSMAQRNCKYSSKDLLEVEEKVMMFLNKDTRKISEKKVPLTNVIETKVLIKKFIKMKNQKKAKKLYKLLLKRVIVAGKGGIKITQNIFEELNDINKLIMLI
jgi:hypothetical protein